jgi:hypothetical protein
VITNTEPLPAKSYVRLEPSYTFIEDGGHSSELEGRVLIVYRGWLIPELEPESIVSGLRVDLPLQHEATPKTEATGLGDLALLQLSGVEMSWGDVGAGLAAVLPTATNDNFGADATQLGPAWFVYVKAIPHFEVSVLMRTFFAVAGTGSQSSTFYSKIKPALVLKLPHAFQLTSDGEAEVDWLADSGSLPVNLHVVHMLGSRVVVQLGPQVETIGSSRGNVTLDLRIDYVDL